MGIATHLWTPTFHPKSSTMNKESFISFFRTRRPLIVHFIFVTRIVADKRGATKKNWRTLPEWSDEIFGYRLNFFAISIRYPYLWCGSMWNFRIAESANAARKRVEAQSIPFTGSGTLSTSFRNAERNGAAF